MLVNSLLRHCLVAPRHSRDGALMVILNTKAANTGTLGLPTYHVVTIVPTLTPVHQSLIHIIH